MPHNFGQQEDPNNVFGQGTFSRGDLFAQQTGPELERRLTADAFGNRLTPLAGRAAGSALNRFADLDPFFEFLQPEQTLGERFGGFTGGGAQGQLANSGNLGRTLNQLVGSAQNAPDAFRAFVPDFQTAASVGLQPGLQGLNPRLRNRLQSNILGDFQTRQAQQPEQFQNLTIENLLALIEEFRQRGFVGNR